MYTVVVKVGSGFAGSEWKTGVVDSVDEDRVTIRLNNTVVDPLVDLKRKVLVKTTKITPHPPIPVFDKVQLIPIGPKRFFSGIYQLPWNTLDQGFD